jgi:hypothetical protein
MALTAQDVLDTLSSYFVTQIDFWVGPIHVCTRNYDKIKDLIETDDIHVVGGTVPNNAYYHPKTNVLTTQGIAPPPDLDARALLLHECTHALVDVEKYTVSRLHDELAAYLAQHTFLLMGNPAFKNPPNVADWFDFFRDVVALAKSYKLHKPEGRGKRIKDEDAAPLLTRLNGLNLYSSLSPTDMASADGVTPSARGRFADHPASFHSTAHESYPEAGDAEILRLLEMRYRATDVAGFGGRVRKLEDIFRHAEPIRAKSLTQRLHLRNPADRMSVVFHDHLARTTRNSLLGILLTRA